MTMTQPFSTQPSTAVSLDATLPAIQRTRDNILSIPCSTLTYFADELDISRLHAIHDWLWAAGRPMPPRPLHHQLLLDRQIFVTERLDLHLLWQPGKIFVKPLPRYLLSEDFWAMLTPEKDHSQNNSIATIARGFLYSYLALINHESDFRIASSLHLLPGDVTWPQWRAVCAKNLSSSFTDPILIDRRFYYGELRLNRINTIYRLTRPGHIMRGYMSRWNDYGTFLRAQFAWAAAATLYTVVVLTAMQVGLATTTLAQNPAFQRASYGFTVFSILAPVVLCASILVVFVVAFIVNWKVALAWKRNSIPETGGRRV